MACNVELQGTLSVGGGCGCSGDGSGSSASKSLSLGCSGASFGQVGETPCPVYVQTAGAPGDAFVTLPGTAELGAIQLLYVKTTAPMVLRVGAEEASLEGAGAAFPVVMAGSEVLDFKADGVAVSVAFDAGSTTAQSAAQQINQAAIAAGLSYLPASVASSGQLELSGVKTGNQGSIEITGALASVGFSSATKVYGEGADLRGSVFLLQLDPSSSPGRVQISGVGQVEVFAAGAAA